MRTRSAGYSDAAISVLESTTRQQHVLRESATLGIQPAVYQLAEIGDECKQPGWDGYNALPVEQSTLSATYTILELLPFGFPLPTLGAEPDGQITLEWRRSPRRIVSVSVDPAGYVHYAGLLGTNERYGKLELFDALPDELVQLIRDL